MPGEKFADNYRQLVALRGIVKHPGICAAGRVEPLRVLSAMLLFQADFGIKEYGGIKCGMKSGAYAMA